MGDDEPSKTVNTQLKQCERREQQLAQDIKELTVEIDRLKTQQNVIRYPEQLREVLQQSTDYVQRAQLREEVRKRVSGIRLHFRFHPLVIADIEFTTGNHSRSLLSEKSIDQNPESSSGFPRQRSWYSEEQKP